ncbi:hypothetical protein O181_115307, partial [Austropuccinia psidii MF-1]|nr:hypothetical protein [Austropuccinia psidii MF-1]
MDQAKVQQILNWLPPRNLKSLQSFLGFANFYHRFIKNYSKKISSLTSFLKKDSFFPFNEKALSNFHQLKEAFTTSPILSHFNPSLPTMVETNASNYALGAVLRQDSQYRSILQELGKGKSIQDYSLDSSSQLLLFKDQVVVANDPTIQLSILQKHHYSCLAGHPGQEKTLKLVKRDFHWSIMTQFIKDYVSSCQQCSRNKHIHHKKFGLLKPLTISNGPWICLSLDFMTQLPLSNSFDSILVIVDRFSKMA